MGYNDIFDFAGDGKSRVRGQRVEIHVRTKFTQRFEHFTLRGGNLPLALERRFSCERIRRPLLYAKCAAFS